MTTEYWVLIVIAIIGNLGTICSVFATNSKQKTVTEMTIEQIKNEVKGFKEVVREDIKRLEDKQDKYNCLKDRMLVVEQSTKSAHHRLDGMEVK